MSGTPVPRTHAGFTLHEVLVVVVLIGIMAMMAGPRFDLSRHRSESAVHAVSTTLMAAQRAAVARQHDVAVAFDAAGLRLRIHHDADNDGIVDAGEQTRVEALPAGAVFGRGGAGALDRLGAGAISFTGRQDGMPVVVFSRGGNASEEGGLYLTSAIAETEGNRSGAARAIVVDRATGRASVLRYGGNGWEGRF